jgi:hypothetical protein
MRTLPFYYYVFESKYGEISIELLDHDYLEYKPAEHIDAWEFDQTKHKFIEG